MHTVKVIHNHVSKNPKGSAPKVICILSVDCGNTYKGTLFKGPFNYLPIYDNDMIWNQIIQTGDPINVLGEAAIQQAVGSPGAVQQLNQITEQVSLETGGDPAQVQGVVQNLALTNSIEGGNTQELIENIETEVAQPNDPVSKSLNSLVMQEEQGNYEVVNTAVEKVAEGVVEDNDVEQLVTTVIATTKGATPLDEGTTGGGKGATAASGEGAAPLGEDEEGGGVAPTVLDEGTTEDEDEITGEELAPEEDDDSDTEEEEEAVAEEDEEVSDDEGDDSEDDGDDGGDGDGGDGRYEEG